jgi:tetratricopeptide (TPR) repeat protein
MGICFAQVGKINQASDYYEQALIIRREIGDRRGEEVDLANLGNVYFDFGDAKRAKNLYEQALAIDIEIGDRGSESGDFENIGNVWQSLGNYQEAVNSYKQAIKIADVISFPQTQCSARCGLAETYLFQNDLVNARATIEVALQYDVPENNHYASALHGIIALRQGERETAQEAFTKSIAQADEILAKTPEYYDALDAKGLALCGLALCAHDDGQLMMDNGKIAEAIETFRKARKIAPHAGVVKSVLRLFDELVRCDEEGILKDVRNAVEGS